MTLDLHRYKKTDVVPAQLAPTEEKPSTKKSSNKKSVVRTDLSTVRDPGGSNLIQASAPAGVKIAPPGSKKVTAPITTSADAPKSEQRGRVDWAGAIWGILNDPERAKALASQVNRLGGLALKLRDVTQDGARKTWDVTKKLWSGSFLGKIGALFTGLASGILRALSSVFGVVGNVMRWVADNVITLFVPESEKEKQKVEETVSQVAGQLRQVDKLPEPQRNETLRKIAVRCHLHDAETREQKSIAWAVRAAARRANVELPKAD